MKCYNFIRSGRAYIVAYPAVFRINSHVKHNLNGAAYSGSITSVSKNRYSHPFSKLAHYGTSPSCRTPEFHLVGQSAKAKKIWIPSERFDDEQIRKGMDKARAIQSTDVFDSACAAENHDQNNIFFYAVTDSGVGGAIATALVLVRELPFSAENEVRTLAHGSCLPIGTQPPEAAAAFTIMMGLWPLLFPLATFEGKDDGRVAQHVFLACNSASVRYEYAIAGMVALCNDAKANPDMYDWLGSKGLERLLTFAQKPDLAVYLKKHVHEIVTPTATEIAQRAMAVLLNDKVDYFARIDSTNGTATSRAYPIRVENVIRSLLPSGTKVTVITADNGNADINKCNITHTVIKFDHNGIERRLLIEGRGNPAWVPVIEANKVDEKGAKMFAESQRQSKDALMSLPEEMYDDVNGFEGVPDLEVLACTHYPALLSIIKDSYGPTTDFLDQSTILLQIVQGVKKSEGIDAEYSGAAKESDPHVSITIGSQNMGGASVEKVVPSGDEGDAKANNLAGVITAGLHASRSNSVVEPAVRFWSKEPLDQDFFTSPKSTFERLQERVFFLNGQKILKERGVAGEVHWNNETGRAEFSMGPAAVAGVPRVGQPPEQT